MDKIFQSKKPDDDPSSGVDNSRYGGPYAAPEAKEESGNVTRKTDVWSLACVIPLVLTFLHNGSKRIIKLQESRGRDRSHDWFFDSKALKSGSANKETLHASVSIWLDTLNEESLRKDKTEVEATRMATELLRDRMFLWDQEKRFSAKDVEIESRKFNPLSQNYLKVQLNRLHPKCELRCPYPYPSLIIPEKPAILHIPRHPGRLISYATTEGVNSAPMADTCVFRMMAIRL